MTAAACSRSVVRATATNDYCLSRGASLPRGCDGSAHRDPRDRAPAGAGDEAEQLDLLCDAMIENEVRSNLDPLQRAQGYQAMIDAGSASAVSPSGWAVKPSAVPVNGGSGSTCRSSLCREAPGAGRCGEGPAAGGQGARRALRDPRGACTQRRRGGARRRRTLRALHVGGVCGNRCRIAASHCDPLPAGLFQYNHSYPLQTFCLNEKARRTWPPTRS